MYVFKSVMSSCFSWVYIESAGSDNMMISFILVLVVQTLDGAIHPADNHYIKQLLIRALRKSPATSKASKDILDCFFCSEFDFGWL